MRNDSKGKLSDKKEALEYRNTTGRIAPEVVNRCASIKKLSFFPLLIIYLKTKLFKDKYIVGFLTNIEIKHKITITKRIES